MATEEHSDQATGQDASRPPLDPAGHYSPEDIVVSTELDLPGEGLARLSDEPPAREVVYRLVRERGPITLADLAREFGAFLPGGVRPPYTQEAAVYVLRLLAGGRAALPALASFESLVGVVARLGPDPHYGFEISPA
ncbi:MAG: hypothetical protein QOK40_1825 [Miltoncostaeaceae bacterium]|nr:hypothetical protein [Miltoncostaeaceae bacterium]